MTRHMRGLVTHRFHLHVQVIVQSKMLQFLRTKAINIGLIKSVGALAHFRWRAQGYGIEIETWYVRIPATKGSCYVLIDWLGGPDGIIFDLRSGPSAARFARSHRMSNISRPARPQSVNKQFITWKFLFFNLWGVLTFYLCFRSKLAPELVVH